MQILDSSRHGIETDGDVAQIAVDGVEGGVEERVTEDWEGEDDFGAVAVGRHTEAGLAEKKKEKKKKKKKKKRMEYPRSLAVTNICSGREFATDLSCAS